MAEGLLVILGLRNRNLKIGSVVGGFVNTEMHGGHFYMRKNRSQMPRERS